MHIKQITLICFLLICHTNSFGQKQTLEYSPVTGTNLEQAFPLVTIILMESFGLDLYQFDYGSRILTSSYFEYYRGISRYRGRWHLSIDDNGTLDIQIIDIQWWYRSKSRWDNSGEGLFSKKETKMRASFAEDIRNNIKNEETIKTAQNWFFTNLAVNAKFYESATDLAGDRWFENYLKDQKVDWNLTFVDIEKNNSSNSSFKFKETFTYTTILSLSSFSFEDSKFFITKFTNKDSNVLTKIGDSKNVLGYCRSIKYDDGKFFVILTDELEDALPINTLDKQEVSKSESNSILEVADQLKKLKELLDLGAISQEEYEEEKTKLLNR